MVKKIISNIIFDLDGTLIDSSTSILESFESAFSACNLEPIKPLNSDIIGPPLMETLSMVSDISDKNALNNLAQEFISHYDTLSYKKTIVFPGINKMLNGLKDSGFNLYIATNKRILPTKKIINYLKWNEMFEGVYSLDSFSPSASSKSEVLSKLIESNNLIKDNVVYVGDREEDKIAAVIIDIKFIMASWSYYGKKETWIDKGKTVSPIDLYNQLLVNN